MKLRTFQAQTMAEAMAAIRLEMGTEAVIVSTFQSRRGRGVEVMAALDGKTVNGRATDIATPAGIGGDELIAGALRYHRVPDALAERLARAAAAFDGSDPTLTLAAAIDADFTFSPLGVVPERPVFLVGPPGAGKTVTIAKLAARAVLAQHPVRVVTTDTVRAGGVDQLAAFTDLLELELAGVDTPDHLRPLLSTNTAGAVFVDTPGINAFDADEVADLQRFLAVAEVEPVLVLAAGGDAVEAAELAETFRSIGVQRMIVTRLDIVRRVGGIVAAADAAGLALSEVSITPFVGEGLKPLNPVSLARLLLNDPTRPHSRSQPEQSAT